jgi:hypothetical protein
VSAEVAEVPSDEVLARRVESTALSTQTVNALHNARIKTLRNLVRRSRGELLELPGFGRGARAEVEAMLADLGLSLGMVVPGSWRGVTPRTLEVDRQDWADFVASCNAVGVSSTGLVQQLIDWELGVAGVELPSPFDVVVASEGVGAGSTSVRVGDDKWFGFVAAARAADSSAAREVRGFVRWVLGRSGARRPARLVSVGEGS